jgi:L-aminopeptidase/D-esterase-like protein
VGGILIQGVRVGHWSDPEARTGCTVVLFPPQGATAGVDVRGSAPGTRETDLLQPGMMVERVHAICLTGGSAFGLAAADGVMRYLHQVGVGFAVGEVRVPIVPAAVIFDLATGSAVHPGPDEGYAACMDAVGAGGEPERGAIGAGTGATVGKLLGPERSSPGGLATATVRIGGGATVAALAVVNALGDVVGRDGRILAGARGDDGPADTWRLLLEGRIPPRPVPANTTLGVVVTDVGLDRAGCRKLAQVAQDALALAIRPVHTRYDGDTVFAASVGERHGDPTAVGVAAVEALRTAIELAVSGG